MGKKSDAAERMAKACESMAAVFEDMQRRDKHVGELQAENDRLREQMAEVVVYRKRLERDLEQRSLEIEKLLREKTKFRDNTDGIRRADPVVP
jgi:hypothetical protein